jgi:hypothetical protein
MAIASLVLGILSLSGWVILIGVFTGFLFGVSGLILGILAFARRRGKKGIAIAGVVCSCLGLAGTILNAIASSGAFGYMF